MVNWNSKESEYKPIKGSNTIAKARMVVRMREQGVPVNLIAELLMLSKSRIYEYLRKGFLQNTLGSE